jgi:predicted PurR-regulated permease PerM
MRMTTFRILQADDNCCDRCAGPASDLASFRCRTGPHRFDLDMRAAPARFRAVHALVQAAARTRLGDLRVDYVITVIAGFYFAAEPDVYRWGLGKCFPKRLRAEVYETTGDIAAALRLWLLFDVVLVLIGSILICVLLQLVSESFTRWCKLPRALALGISGLIIFGAFGGAGYLFGTQIGSELQDVVSRADTAIKNMADSMEGSEFGKMLLSHFAGGNFP